MSPREGNYAMNHMTIDFAPFEEDIFAFGFSDEAIEAAAGMGIGAEDTLNCTPSNTSLCATCKCKDDWA